MPKLSPIKTQTELHSSLLYLQDDDCGFYVADLCDESGSDCVQEDSTAEVVMPEPIAGNSGDGYRVRIAEVGTDNFRCSQDFCLVSSADAALVGVAGGATMDVVVPVRVFRTYPRFCVRKI